MLAKGNEGKWMRSAMGRHRRSPHFVDKQLTGNGARKRVADSLAAAASSVAAWLRLSCARVHGDLVAGERVGAAPTLVSELRGIVER